MTDDTERAATTARRIDERIEVAEAEATKPLQTHRATSPTEAKREMDRSRERIESTLQAMKAKVEDEVDDVKRTLDVPQRLRDKVRSDPWRSLAVAAGVGLGLALLSAGRKRGYDTLTKDEIDEIRAWRKERRRHLDRLETLLEKSTRRQTQPSLRERIRSRLRADGDRD